MKYITFVILILSGITLVYGATNSPPGTLEIIPNPFPEGSEPPDYSILIIDGKTGLEGATNAPSITFVCYPGGIYTIDETPSLTNSWWTIADFVSTFDNTEITTYRYYVDTAAMTKFFLVSPF